MDVPRHRRSHRERTRSALATPRSPSRRAPGGRPLLAPIARTGASRELRQLRRCFAHARLRQVGPPRTADNRGSTVRRSGQAVHHESGMLQRSLRSVLKNLGSDSARPCRTTPTTPCWFTSTAVSDDPITSERPPVDLASCDQSEAELETRKVLETMTPGACHSQPPVPSTRRASVGRRRGRTALSRPRQTGSSGTVFQLSPASADTKTRPGRRRHAPSPRRGPRWLRQPTTRALPGAAPPTPRWWGAARLREVRHRSRTPRRRRCRRVRRHRRRGRCRSRSGPSRVGGSPAPPCVLGNAQRPDRPVAPVDDAGQEPFAGIRVHGMGWGAGNSTNTCSAESIVVGWSSHVSAPRWPVTESINHAAGADGGSCEDDVAKMPRRIGRRALTGRGRRRSPTGRSAPRDCPPSRSHRPNPPVRRTAVRSRPERAHRRNET